jgi:hypothetical protein
MIAEDQNGGAAAFLRIQLMSGTRLSLDGPEKV